MNSGGLFYIKGSFLIMLVQDTVTKMIICLDKLFNSSILFT